MGSGIAIMTIQAPVKLLWGPRGPRIFLLGLNKVKQCCIGTYSVKQFGPAFDHHINTRKVMIQLIKCSFFSSKLGKKIVNLLDNLWDRIEQYSCPFFIAKQIACNLMSPIVYIPILASLPAIYSFHEKALFFML